MLSDFAVFVMVYGRPEKMWTYHSLRKQGYTGKVFLVADDLDETVDEYKEKYGDELLVFDKKKSALDMDVGDNSGDFRSTLFAANTIFELAEENSVKYFMIMCDDYTRFIYKFDEKLKFKERPIKDLDSVFDALLKFYISIDALTIAMAQNGDFIGGKNSAWAREVKLHRKVMNTFLCSTERPFKFMGRMNEDVTTYVNLGSKGELFLTVPNVAIIQNPTQSQKGGWTEFYLEMGTYVKSFYSVMYNPSCVKVAEMGDKHKRIHHKVIWNNAVPKIISNENDRVLY